MTTEIGELTERYRQNRKRQKISDVDAVELGDRERDLIDRECDALDKPVYKVRPYRGEGGVREAITLLNGMHETAGDPETHAFEICYNDEILDFRFVPGSGIVGKNLRDQLFEDYPDSTVEQLPDAFPALEDDKFIAGARMHFFKSTEYPIRHIDIDGFGDESSGRSNSRDPFKSVLTKVTGGSTDVMLQVVFKPSQQGFGYRSKMAKVAERMRAPNTRFLTDYPPTDKEKTAADIIENQQNESMYEIEVRLFAAASTKEAAESRVHSVVHALDEFYESHNRQGFYGVPVSGGMLRSDRSEMHSFLTATASRSFEGYTNMKCTASELAGVVHLSGDVNNSHIDYSESRAGIPVPIGTPRFEFAEAGLDETATPLDRQVELFRSSEPGAPYWIGTGARKGTEAGIHEDVFKQHVFVPGATGYGKTTLLKNLFFQMMRRDAGGMFYDPKGDDAFDVLSLVPEGREDDVIHIELGGNRDKQVGFNFLEVPSSEDPDTPAYKEAVEALADDLEALISLAGGDDDFWGPRMARVTRNMVRGMSKAGYDCTILDMYFALVSQERREQYAQMLEDERIDWIVEYAREHLADMPDKDLEPLVGRLQQWIENPITRELVSYPKSTFSVEEAVREGKIIIVEDNTTSETVGTMVATALIRRIWVAVREQSRIGEQPPMFYSILDEFDKIISSNSNIARILSLARSKNLSILGACQDLSNQVDDEQIQNAILGQCRTILNLNPQRDGEARLMAKRHSEDITAQDLINLGDYKLYMRTSNDHGEPTKSYKVGTFPPVDEVDDVARTEEETEALIERSLEQYGGERRTSEDQKRDSKFYDYDADETDDHEHTEEREALILKAAYDLALTDNECDDGFVADDRVRELAAEWMGIDTLRGPQFWGMVDYIPDTRLERSERNDAMHLRCTPEGKARFLATGSSQTSGKGKHRELLKDAYDPLTLAGLDIHLPIQVGEESADGIGKVPFETTVSLRNAADVAAKLQAEYPVLFEFTDGGDVALEAESSTGRTQPSQTLVNLRKAVDKDQKCVFLCREKTADTVEGTLTEPPFRAKDGSFYNHSGRAVSIDGMTFPRPDGMTESVWREQGDQIVLEDQDGRVYARFDSPEAVFEDADAYPESQTDGDGTGCITKPVIPGEWSDDDYEVVVVPEDAESPSDLLVRRDGRDLPLSELPRGDDDNDSSPTISDRLDAI